MNKRISFSNSKLRDTPFQLLPNVIHSAEAQEKCLNWQAEFANARTEKIHFRILLDEASPSQLESLKVQSYKNFSIGKVDESADYYIVIPKNCILHPQALFIFYKEVIKNSPELIYTNEVFLNPELTRAKNFLRKQASDKYTFLSWDYFGDCLVIKKDYVNYLFGLKKLKEKLINENAKISFIPLGIVNYYAEQKLKIKSPPTPNDLGGKVQVIIPFKNETETTISCLKSLEKQSCLIDLEICLANNNSDPNELVKIKEFIAEKANFKLITVDSYFNFAAINNTVASTSNTPYIFFLNNDVTLTNENCISKLRAWCAQAEVGAVGGKLSYPDGSIQHAGINFISVRPANMRGEETFSHITRETNAVTFAMALIKRDAYQAIGGLDEFHCPNGFGDTLFCLEIKKRGWRTIFTPEAEGTHYESKSRGASPEELEWLEMVQEGLPIPDFYADFVAVNQPTMLELGGINQSKVVSKIKGKIKKVVGM